MVHEMKSVNVACVGYLSLSTNSKQSVAFGPYLTTVNEHTEKETEKKEATHRNRKGI